MIHPGLLFRLDDEDTRIDPERGTKRVRQRPIIFLVSETLCLWGAIRRGKVIRIFPAIPFAGGNHAIGVSGTI